MKQFLTFIGAEILCVSLPLGVFAQIFVADQYYPNPRDPTGYGRVGDYALSGPPLNPFLISGLSTYAADVVISGNNLLVYSVAQGTGVGTIGLYGLDGTPINPSLITGLSSSYIGFGMAVSGRDIYVVTEGNGSIGHYTLSGTTVNPSLITGLSHPDGIAVSGGHLFVTTYGGTVAEYGTDRTPINTSLISGLGNAWGIAVQDNNIYLANSSSGTVGKYTTSGAVVNPSLISGLRDPVGLALNGDNLFVSMYGLQSGRWWAGSGIHDERNAG